MNRLIIIALASLTVFLSGADMVCAESAPNNPDAQVIYELKKAGSDLNKEHSIEFFIYFNSRAVAESASKKLKGDGFETKIDKSASSDEWLLLATKKMLPSLIELQAIRNKLYFLTENGKGEYDGWGTPVVQ